MTQFHYEVVRKGEEDEPIVSVWSDVLPREGETVNIYPGPGVFKVCQVTHYFTTREGGRPQHGIIVMVEPPASSTKE